MEREYYCKSNDDQQSLSPACPRCGSLNTKFCYYNNYSLTQPRYFCKGCRRYWTKGGSLRNVPIGGGCRKSRRGRTTTINNNRVVSTDGGGGGILQHTTINSVSTDDRHNHGSTSIDLAAVYANFLNHHQQSPPRPRQPENINQINLPPLPDGILIPSIVEFSGFHQEINNGFFECGSSSSFTDNPRLLMPESSNTNTPPLLGGGSSNMFFQGLFQKHAGNSSFNDGGIILPPLPGEDVVAVADSRGTLWPDSDVILPDQIFPPATNNETAGAAVGGNLSPRFSDGLNNLEAIFRT